MLNIFLTKSTGILGPVANGLGKIMEWLYSFFDLMGIANIGLCIIAFTIVVKLLMLPLTIKQQKFTKLSSMMNPELQAVQKKYKDKRDPESMTRMREETNAIYDKYGTSPTGSCLQILIQMPILFALYRVIMNIPAYVPQIKSVYMNIVDAINPDKLASYLELEGKANVNQIIDTLAKFSPDNWDKLTQNFSGSADVITSNVDQIHKLNGFFGINLSQSPLTLMGIALIIPVLAALAQWFSTKLMTANQSTSTDDNPMGSSMKMMNMTMPIISGVLCLTMSTGVGLYWIMTSVVQIVQQYAINKYFNKVDVNDLIKSNIEKKNKKRAKKGLPPQKVTSVANINTKNIENKPTNEKNNKNKEEQIKKSTEYYNKSNAKPGSLAAKANMVSLYNEKNNKNNKNKKSK